LLHASYVLDLKVKVLEILLKGVCQLWELQEEYHIMNLCKQQMNIILFDETRTV